jgi:hypothetical protein
MRLLCLARHIAEAAVWEGATSYFGQNHSNAGTEDVWIKRLLLRVAGTL